MKIKNEALTEKELDTLAEILEDVSPYSMNLEMLDGFFCALICSPTLVQPSAYIPVIFGEDYNFTSEKQATTFFELSMRHWNFIAGELLESLDKPNAYFPIIFEDENGIKQGNDWAIGFMQGVEIFPHAWDNLINNQEHSGAIIPMMTLCEEYDLDKPITTKEREEAIISMVSGLVYIYRFFAPYRASSTTTIRREGVKVGRNDPCPCGSNRKYKQCCGNNSPTIH